MDNRVIWVDTAQFKKPETRGPCVVIAAHKPLAGDPRYPYTKARGGETSVAGIRDRVAEELPVLTIVKGVDRFDEYIKEGDVVLTWGTATASVMDYCVPRGIPYVMMVRWWRSVSPLPPGDLMKRWIDPDFQAAHRPLFENAAAVVTNNRYAAKVLKRWYGVEALVSYVAVPGEAEPGGNPNGSILIVTDNKGARAEEIARGVAARLPRRMILVLNAYERYTEENIIALPYERDMESRYREASILLNPIYDHDGCGTGRTMMEAMRFGVPVIGSRRAGLLENGGEGVSRDASPEEWARKIEKILGRYPYYQERARRWFSLHDAEAELDVFVKLTKTLIAQ